MNHCLRHFEEPVAASCRDCGHPFCGRCLVYSFGPKKPPYCVGCALHASGIRAGNRVVDAGYVPAPVETGDLAMDKRTERAFKRAERDAAKQQAKAAKVAAKAAAKAGRKGTTDAGTEPAPMPVAVGEAARSAQVPAPSQLLARTSAGPGGL